MKKILVVASDMEIGGAERALLGLLEALNKKKYQVDLFLLRHAGPFMQFIPEGVNLLPENSKYSDLGVPIQDVLIRGHLGMAFGRARGKYKAKRFIAKNNLKKENSVEIHYSFKYTLNFLPEISNFEYDLALGFTTPYYIIDKKVHAKKKAVWIHTDYSTLDGDRNEEQKVWEAYPFIVSISEAVTNSFLKIYPGLKDRIYPIDNIVSEELIQKQANIFDVEKEMASEKGVIKILSIGRFTKAKNFDNVPDICAQIISMGILVKWYIIGYGNDRKLIERKIKEANMEYYVSLLGRKENPYPYIKNCDIYIQPSRYEGKAVAVKEAQILHKPVVITNFPTASSQLRNGIDGIIVPMDNSGCAKGIVDLLKNSEKIQNLIDNCSTSRYSNCEEIEKIYALL